jgi:hypothetical protein
MNQNAAGTLNQYPNLIELIGRQSELLGTAMWGEPAIGSDDPAIGSDDITIGSDDAIIDSGLNPSHDNILQDDINGPLIAGSVTDHEAIGQDDIFNVGRFSICSDDVIGRDDLDDIAQTGTISAS